MVDSVLTPYIAEQVRVLAVIAQHGKQSVQKGEDKSRQLDHWQHMEDELKFLAAMLYKHPPYTTVRRKDGESS